MAYVWQSARLNPQRLTTIARYILLAEDRPENEESLRDYFPPSTVVGTRAEWKEQLTRPFTASVPFRSLSTPMPVGKRPGSSRRAAGMGPLGISFEFTEHDMLMEEAERAGADPESFFEPEIFADVEAGMVGAMNRMESLMGELIVNGGFTINENGVYQPVTSGRAAGNTAAAGIAWSTANVNTALPHTDEHTALNYLRTTQGLTWRDVEVLTNRVTYNQYKSMASVKSAFQSVRALDALGDDQVNELRNNQGLPPIRVFERMVEDANDVLQSVIPNNAWVIVPRRGTQPLGKQLWGTPQSANLQGVRLQGDARRGPVAYVLEDANPISRLTVVDAIGAPVLQAPNWCYHLQTNAGL